LLARLGPAGVLLLVLLRAAALLLDALATHRKPAGPPD
jgi:hypothetical protein